MNFFNIDEELLSFAQEEAIIDGHYIDFEIAMEEDTTTSSNDSNIDDEEKKRKIGEVIGDKVKKLVQEIIAIIDRLFLKLKNVIGRVLTTDKGFKKQIRTAIADHKPLEGIKLVSYIYNDATLDSIHNKISGTIFKIIGSLKTSYSEEMNEENKHPLDMSKDDLYKYVLSKAGCPDDVTDLNLFFEYTKKAYRKEKKEMLFLSENTKDYYDITLSYNQIEQEITKKNTLMRQQVSILRSNLSNISKNNQLPNAVKKRAMRQATNASLLYNFYSSVLSMYIEMKTEKILTYRIVLKKLYRI